MSKRASARTGARGAAKVAAVEAKPETVAPVAAPAAAAPAEPVAVEPAPAEAAAAPSEPIAAEPAPVEAVPGDAEPGESASVEALPDEPVASEGGEAEFDLDGSAVLVVRGPQRGRYRAGRHFAREEVRILASELDDQQVAAILGDPELTVVIEQDAR